MMTLAQVAQHPRSQQSARNLPTEGTRTDQTEQTDLGFETKTAPSKSLLIPHHQRVYMEGMEIVQNLQYSSRCRTWRRAQDAFWSSCSREMTTEIMKDPVVTHDGHVYERSGINEWFRSRRSQHGSGKSSASKASAAAAASET